MDEYGDHILSIASGDGEPIVGKQGVALWDEFWGGVFAGLTGESDAVNYKTFAISDPVKNPVDHDAKMRHLLPDQHR